MTGSTLSRRGLLAGATAAAALAHSGAVFARAKTEKRFVFVILRGALDGLTAVPPVGDPGYAPLRRKTLIAADAALPLSAPFALHPSFATLHELYRAKEALVVHAAATPYRQRSHFDGQDVLENGGVSALELSDGWLNRAIAELKGARGLAVGQQLPLAMRGPAPAASWAPSNLPEPDEDTAARLAHLYDGDPILGPALQEAMATQAVLEGAATMNGAKDRSGGYIAVAARAGARLLAAPDGPRIAMLQFPGWDTHVNEGGAQGQLANRLAALDRGFAALKEELGPAWRDTVVVVATEFGRTARENGDGGTDHGTGAAAFVLGGAVRGGRVLADWPGLRDADLYQNRDLRPTSDLRAVFKGVLSEHLGIARKALDTNVFPDSSTIKPVEGLVA